jgi:ribosomal protein S18 acetylase RimI-like enzyme
MSLSIRPVVSSDIPVLLSFTDKWIGYNYFGQTELTQYFDQSCIDDKVCSFVAVNKNDIVGLRLTLAPGKWIDKNTRGLSPLKWDVDPNKLAYFKSLFIAQDFQGNSLGKELSNASIKVLKEMGAQAILCHSWLESPNNSSQRYLEKMGFEEVERYPLFWEPIDYMCTRCAPSRCQCTAAEMIKYI